ncbi:MAG: glycosyltransferase [Desulfomonile tiedjei]|uniref:Glycosyltransferase n=1 Tax=Desulfomonile tiedjei TaxID=2358 RepID=A0A9D6V5Q1_9BACT|nr:glycosyltransferase [Desulfomonile tiedjei]
MSSGWLVWVGLVFCLIVLAELARLNFLLYLAFKNEIKLPNLAHHRTGARGPRVTVIVPAKDEESHIERTAKSILDSEYADMDLILIDDRSSDRTGEIIRSVAKEDPRVRVMSVKDLPSGWTGKTHAMFHAAATTSSDILLFTDADAVLEKDVISKAVNFMVDRNLDMLSLLPGFTQRGFLENAVHLHLGLGLSSFYSLTDVNDATRESALASGCFIMIRREAYQAVGTWREFKEQVTEDIALSKAVKRNGLRLNVLRGENMVTTKPFESFSELAGFWKRTFYGGLEKNIPRMTRLCLNFLTLIVLFGIFVYSALVLASETSEMIHIALFVISCAGMAAVMISYGIVVKKEHGSALYGLSAPLGLFLGAWIAISTFLMVWTDQGIQWRGSVYK